MESAEKHHDAGSPRRISRRAALGIGATGIAAIGIAAGADKFVTAADGTPEASPVADPHAGHGGPSITNTAAATSAPPFVPVSGQPLADPPRIASSGGLLETTMTMAVSPTMFAGQSVLSAVPNGSFPGPTIVLNPGDIWKNTVVNRLDDCTNVHTHGFHVSPKDNSDNIFVHIGPGETFDYEYHIPDNHPPGIYWYHPHCHGNTAEKTTAGLTGAIIINGGLDNIEGIAGLTDRLLYVQGSQYDGNGKMVPFDQQAPATRLHTVNAQYQPTISIQPGETQRWRIANACSDDFLLLQLQGHTMYEIAKDGNPCNAVVPVDQVLLGPAERVEVLIQAGSSPGSYQLSSLPWGIDYQAQPQFLLATMVVEGVALEPQPLPGALIPYEDLSLEPVDRYRVTAFQELGPPLFLAIDGKHFDANRIDQTVKLGALEEWEVRNESTHYHPFHIHVNDFQIVAVNGQAVVADSYDDTINLPPAGSVTIRMRFADFDGKFVYHCHILSHEDFGMMATVEVVP
jgi:FtsP/CotA-like multicopper oxidase with cupredoxin domain